HEFSENTYETYQKVFRNKLIRFTEREKIQEEHTALLVDTTGYLSSLYAYAQIAYIGGVEHHRIHNIQEPAGHGLPLSFGPRYKDFKEAGDLIQNGGAKEINTAEALGEYIQVLMQNENLRNKTGLINRNYIESKAGATGQIFNVLKAGNYL